MIDSSRDTFQMKTKKKIVIVGGGVAAMMLAVELDSDLFEINIYEKGIGLGKKFLVAGKGGFNLTHSEPTDIFTSRYEPSSFLKPFIEKFNNNDLRKWLENIGIPTMIGSSKKIYPVKGIKPVEVLNAIIDKLRDNKVKVHYNYELIDILSHGEPVFKHSDLSSAITADIVVFALGGASWKVTGSDGKWIDILNKAGVETVEFEPSNCAFEVDWSNSFLTQNEGKPLKNITTFKSGKTVKGELMITGFGLEGGAIYAMSNLLRKELNKKGKTDILIDLKPNLTSKEIENKFKILSGTKSITNILKQYVKLDKTKIDLIKNNTTKKEFNDIKKLSSIIKKLKINISGIAEIDEAISTVGGISLNAIDQNMKIKALPNHYAIGEMLDWDAPTGGYLLQASFSMGYSLASYLNQKYS